VLPVRRPLSSLLQRFFSLRSSHNPRRSPTPAFVAARPDACPFAYDPTSLIIGTPAFQIHCQDFWEKKKKEKRKRKSSFILYYIILYCINNFIKYDVPNSGCFFPLQFFDIKKNLADLYP
jgi:hypothetical protein